MEEERERIERDPYGYSYEECVEEEDELIPPREGSTSAPQHGSPVRTEPVNGPQMYRKRHSNPVGQSRQSIQPIARPDPIQRPGRVSLPPLGPGGIHLHLAHTHSQSVPSAKRTPPSNNDSMSGSSSSTSPIPAGSNLFSRAPTFEPRGLRSDLNPSSVPFEPRAGLLPIGGLQAKAESSKKAGRM